MTPEIFPNIKSLLDMQIQVEPAPDHIWELKIDVQTEPITFLRLNADGAGFSTPLGDDIPGPGREKYYALLDQLGFKLKSGHLFRDQKQIFWLHTTGFGWDDEPMAETGLFLYFDADGNPLSWQVK
jgi:hypothetical protein